MKTGARGADRNSQDRAARTFAAHLCTLRWQHARSLQDMASCTAIPRWRIDRLVTGQTLPSWDEAQALAWHFKVPISRLILPLQRARTAPRNLSTSIRPWTTPRANAIRTWSLQTLATAHPRVFDVTLAQWPAWLAPSLAECLTTEIASLHINAELLADCLGAARALRSLDHCPDHSIRCVGDGLRDVLDATVGVQSRLLALATRHTLRLRSPHSISVHRLAVGLDAAWSALNHPIGLLRNGRWDEAGDAIAALNETANALRAGLLVQ